MNEFDGEGHDQICNEIRQYGYFRGNFQGVLGLVE